MITGKKLEFIDALREKRGIVRDACLQVGINRSTYYRWRKEDDEFVEEADLVMDEQGDLVESRLLDLIEAGDTSATIFYCKTKLKNRGYTERNQETKKQQPEPEPVEIPDKFDVAEMLNVDAKEVTRLVDNKKRYLIKQLKAQNKYSEELSMQVKITAQLLVKKDMLAEEVLSTSHKSILVQTSREGDARATVNPQDKLYLDYAQQSQRALRALGMNNDAKDRKDTNDGLADFMNQFSNND
jgi:hypothetical protein